MAPELRYGIALKRWILAAWLGYGAFFVSSAIRFANAPVALERELNVLDGRGFHYGGEYGLFAEFTNRILFAILLRSACSLGVLSASEWYLVLRFGTAIVMFYVLLRYAALYLKEPQAMLATAGFALCLPFAFNHGIEHASDFLDPLFMVLFAYAVVSGKRSLLVAGALLCAAQRESAVFAGLLWLCVHSLAALQANYRRRALEFGFGVAVALLSYAAVLGLRFAIAGEQGLRRLQDFNLARFFDMYLWPVLSGPRPFDWPLLLGAALAPGLYWIYHKRANLDQPAIGLLLAALATFAASITLASANEVRIFLPTMVFLWCAAIQISKSETVERV